MAKKKDGEKTGPGKPGGGKVLRCESCDYSSPAAQFQDKRYGPGMRAMNYAWKARGGTGSYRCTVCGTERV